MLTVFAAIIININFVSIEWIKKRVMNLSKILRISSVRRFSPPEKKTEPLLPTFRKSINPEKTLQENIRFATMIVLGNVNGSKYL